MLDPLLRQAGKLRDAPETQKDRGKGFCVCQDSERRPCSRRRSPSRVPAGTLASLPGAARLEDDYQGFQKGDAIEVAFNEASPSAACRSESEGQKTGQVTFTLLGDGYVLLDPMP